MTSIARHYTARFVHPSSLPHRPASTIHAYSNPNQITGQFFRSPRPKAGYGFLLRADRSEQSFIDGAENGFGIDGMYVNDGATRPSMAILAGEDMEWQICNDDGSCLSGRLAATSDPNSFDLLDDDGADCGSVHLSYASRDGMDGILYVSHETGDFKMHRTNWVPAFIEE